MSSKVIDISEKKLSMERNGYIYKLQVFRKDKMAVDTLVFKNDAFIQKETISFAQLTKSLKQKLN